ncbi:hypothetical protein LUZ60_011312 [Juncus effusus]|nr:hypothetical protein LUZ60_011312 [Juncus effusus]
MAEYNAPPDFLTGNPGNDMVLTACYSDQKQASSMIGEWIFQNQSHNIFGGRDKSDLISFLHGDLTTNNGGLNFLGNSFPHLLALIILIVVLSRILHFGLRHLKLARIVSLMIAGILVFSFLSPKTKAGSPDINDYGIIDPKIRRVEMVVGSIGILYNIFSTAVKFDPALMFQRGKKKPIIIGFSSVIVPFIAGSVVFVALKSKQLESFVLKKDMFLPVVVYPFCVTFPITQTDMLTELGLLNSELARVALSSSMIQFVVMYWLFAIPFVVYRQSQIGFLYGLVTLLTFVAILAFIHLVIRPYARHIVRTTLPGTRVKGIHIFIIIIVVYVLALVSDIAGYIFVDGPTFMGLALPQGAPLGTALLERVDLVATELILPIVFMHEGFLFDWAGLKEKLSIVLWVEFVVLVVCIVKILTNIAAARYCKMSFKDGFIIGLIMSFRGLVDMLLFLSLTTEQNLLDNTAFTAMILSNIVITITCVPLVSLCYKPCTGKNIGLRTVQHIDSNEELRLMSCFYDNKSVPALLEFLESTSSPNINESVCMYILRIVELQGAAESSLISHRNKKGYIDWAQMDPIHNHFISFEQTKERGVTVMPFTSIAPRKTLHNDVCSLIVERNISLVIVPFPSKNSMADLEADLAMRDLVPLLLEQAQCSVGIMVYHGTTRIMMHPYWQYHVGVIFWGGRDDREALAIASRLARHTSVYLCIFHFVISGKSRQHEDDETEQAADEELIAEVRATHDGNNRISVSRIPIEDVEQAFSELHALGDQFDLLIVGRAQKRLLLLSEALTDFTESPELGVMGEMLATEISCVTNLLIVQQHKL